MKNRTTIVVIILLIVSIGNYFRFIKRDTIRDVEFLSILAIGILFGILLTRIFPKIWK